MKKRTDIYSAPEAELIVLNNAKDILATSNEEENEDVYTKDYWLKIKSVKKNELPQIVRTAQKQP